MYLCVGFMCIIVKLQWVANRWVLTYTEFREKGEAWLEVSKICQVP